MNIELHEQSPKNDQFSNEVILSHRDCLRPSEMNRLR